MNGERYRMFVSLRGIRCAGCFTAIETALRRQGAEAVDIDPVSRTATVRFIGRSEDARGYCEAIRAAGYPSTLFAVLPDPDRH